MLPGPHLVRDRLALAAGAGLVAEAAELGEIARAVRRRVVGRGRRNRRLIRVFAEEDLVLDLARQGRLGSNAPRRSDHDCRECDDRCAYDDPYNELQHAVGS